MDLKRAHQLEKVRIACAERGISAKSVGLWEVSRLLGVKIENAGGAMRVAGYAWDMRKDRIESQSAELIDYLAKRCNVDNPVDCNL